MTSQSWDLEGAYAPPIPTIDGSEVALRRVKWSGEGIVCAMGWKVFSDFQKIDSTFFFRGFQASSIEMKGIGFRTIISLIYSGLRIGEVSEDSNQKPQSNTPGRSHGFEPRYVKSILNHF